MIIVVTMFFSYLLKTTHTVLKYLCVAGHLNSFMCSNAHLLFSVLQYVLLMQMSLRRLAAPDAQSPASYAGVDEYIPIKILKRRTVRQQNQGTVWRLRKRARCMRTPR
jgi:hypothetical protein